MTPSDAPPGVRRGIIPPMNIGPPPFIHYDVACPVILDDAAVPQIQPYVVNGGGPMNLPPHLIVLQAGLLGGLYVHLDPRQVVYKRDELIRSGNIPSNGWAAWLYDLQEDLVHPCDIYVLFPGTTERFYFNPVRDRVDRKAKQIADPKFRLAEWYCPDGRSVIVGYTRGEELHAGVDVAAMMKAPK